MASIKRGSHPIKAANRSTSKKQVNESWRQYRKAKLSRQTDVEKRRPENLDENAEELEEKNLMDENF